MIYGVFGMNSLKKLTGNPTCFVSHGFAVGDRVIYANHRKGKIIKLDNEIKGSGALGALVEWDEKNLCPPQMSVPYSTIVNLLPASVYSDNAPMAGQLILNKSRLDPETHCPTCDTEWTKTQHQTGVWYDCLKCCKKKEDIVNQR